MKEKKPVYIRCPRCELNYILKKDKFCNVCKADMQANNDFIDELSLEICPICKTNYIQPDEVVCVNCLKERQRDPHFGDMDEEEWEQYLTRDEEEIVSPDEETGEMSSVTDFDDDVLEDTDLEFEDADNLEISDEDEDETEDDDYDDSEDEDEDEEDDDEDEEDDDDDDDDDF